MLILKQAEAIILCFAIATPVFALQTPATPNPSAGQSQAATQAPPMASSAPSQKDLQQLVAPIALYPDALIGQIMAGATYPTQIVEAERWLQQNSNLKSEKLAAEVDKQPWDPSIKALTQFPSVLQNMSKNLTWTSSLGDAYFNDPDGVMNAVQALRKDATNAGTLKSTPEQTVTTEGQTIIIQPANPEVVYVPDYSPAVVYGTAIEPYPGYSGWEVAAASALTFGAGMFMGAAMSGWGWGWGHWGMDWHGGNVNFNRNAYVSRSNTFANRNTRYGAANRNRVGAGNVAANRNRVGAGNVAGRNKPTGINRAGVGAAGGRTGQGLGGGNLRSGASRGFGQAGQGARGTRGNTFSGFGQGGSARRESSRGSSSFRGGGGGGFRGGGGRGGGGRGGGGRGGGGRGGGRRR